MDPAGAGRCAAPRGAAPGGRAARGDPRGPKLAAAATVAVTPPGYLGSGSWTETKMNISMCAHPRSTFTFSREKTHYKIKRIFTKTKCIINFKKWVNNWNDAKFEMTSPRRAHPLRKCLIGIYCASRSGSRPPSWDSCFSKRRPKLRN